MSSMNYHFTKHALRRMEKRNISEEDVLYCIANQHTSYPGEADCIQYIADIKGRNLKVVVNEVKGNIVTAVWKVVVNKVKGNIVTAVWVD
jgi:hypothetical protein